MRILLISTAFSGLTQRFYTELSDAGFEVSVELHCGDDARLQEGVELFKPELIVCPYLTRRIPEAIYRQYTCLIVHPGIKGDRGPSSLDWAIQEGKREWGVTLLAADAEMDAGPIWASRTFPLRHATKSSIFNREVSEAAVECLWEALSYCQAPAFRPETLDYRQPDVKGRLRPAMKQTDRHIDWQRDTTDTIVRKIRAADGSPGVLDEFYGQAFYLFNAHPETTLSGQPGSLIAIAEQAVCRATVDGAIWIGHLQAKSADGKGIKLPATLALAGLLPPPHTGLRRLFADDIHYLAIDYARPGRQVPVQEVWYELDGDIAYLHFGFHNGGMSNQQCRLLEKTYRHVAGLNVKAIVLLGGEDCWSNGIHLNHIEAAADPAHASWLNIQAIDDLIAQIIATPDKLTVAAVRGNAGAGGAILALAADRVWARHGTVFNPHYRNMGGLYGSEYWTYLLPKRVGLSRAERLTEECLPISAQHAWRIGMVDRVLDKRPELFLSQVQQLVRQELADPHRFGELLNSKAMARCRDEAEKPLACYRQEELARMFGNFYGSKAYHDARRRFVYKQPVGETPLNIARHRTRAGLATARRDPENRQAPYRLGLALFDRQHQHIVELAGLLSTNADASERKDAANALYKAIDRHFHDEEELMLSNGDSGYAKHVAEHDAIRGILAVINSRVGQGDWRPADIDTFLQTWRDHVQRGDNPLLLAPPDPLEPITAY